MQRNNWLKLKRYSLPLVSILVVVAFALPKPVSAGVFDVIGNVKDLVLDVLGWVLYLLLIQIGGMLATIATKVLVYVAQFNNFTNLPVIIEAWAVVRDVSNMFFIVILLVIAFGTLFRIEAYNWKKLLPKMVIAAILVNFSRAICGLIVDASQVIMLTFVAAIKDAASVGLAEAFNLSKLLSFGTDTATQDSAGNVSALGTNASQRLVAIVAAGFMLLTLLTVQCVYIVVLVGRMVMIWFLTVLSPLAYVMRVLPQTERYASQWWELFGRYVTVGPLAMFFLWLAMFIAAKSVSSGGLGGVAAGAQLANLNTGTVNNVAAGTTGIDFAPIFSQELLAGFVVATLMLMAGMKLTLENSSELGQATGKAAEFGKTLGRASLAFTAGAGYAAGKYGGGYLNDLQFSKFGVLDFNLNRVKHRWQHGFETNQKARIMEGESKAAQKYREGYLLAGAFGAGDQVAELGLGGGRFKEQLRGGVFGNIPILRGDPRFRQARGVWGGRQGAFERALAEERKAEDNSALAGRAYEDKKTGAMQNHMTVDQYSAEVSELQNAVSELGGLNLDGLDMSDASHRRALQNYRQELQVKFDTGSADDKAKAAVSLNLIDNALSGKGKLDSDALKAISGDGTGSALQSSFATAKARAAARLADLQSRRDQLTHGMTLRSKEDIVDHVNTQYPDVAAALKAKEEAEEHLEHAKHERSKYGSQMGSAAEIKARAFINDAKKNITSNDTSELQDGLEDALHKGAGYGPEALAYLDRLFETGNENDVMRMPHIKHALEEIMKRDNPEIVDKDGNLTEDVFSYYGFRALEKHLVERTGLNQQLVRASLHRGFQHAKSNGHFIASEMTELKNGQVEWRTKDAYEEISEIEANKKEPMWRSRTATRLEWGDGGKFYEGQRRRLENYAAILTRAQSTDKRLQINLDKLRHIWADKKRYHVQRNAILRKLGPGKEGVDAVRAYNEAFRQAGYNVPAKYDGNEIVGEYGKEPNTL